jgi:hypothetical protein
MWFVLPSFGIDNLTRPNSASSTEILQCSAIDTCDLVLAVIFAVSNGVLLSLPAAMPQQ